MTTTAAYAPFRIPPPAFNLPRAARAFTALLRNPDDLPKVFTLVDSMSGTAIHRLVLRMKLHRTGARLLREQPDIVPLLADRAWLRALPEGSLGKAYLDFVESEGISAEGIREASEIGRMEEPATGSFMYVEQRMRDTHDLWHAVTGYKGDVAGELSILAFTLAQNWNLAIAMIIVGGIAKGIVGEHQRLILEGYRRGRKAEFFVAQEWETLLPLPLAEVRRRLGVGDPPVYAPIRTSQLRAEGLLEAS